MDTFTPKVAKIVEKYGEDKEIIVCMHYPPFNEYEIFNGLRWYRILFMIGASSLGIIGVVFSFIYFIINMISTNSFGMPYLTPFVPTNLAKLKDSIIRINPRRQ